MFQNYFKIAYRHLFRNKSYVLINVCGLGISLACDSDFDKMHRQAEQIFRVETIDVTGNNVNGWCPLPLAVEAAEKLSEVEVGVQATRSGLVMRNGEKVFNENPMFASINFLDVFDYEVKIGDKSVLKDPNKILITESLAKKYFGDSNPIGQSLTINSGREYQKDLEVGAILKDVPLNTTIQFSALCSIDNLYDWGEKVKQNDWQRMLGFSFLKLKNPANAPQVAAQLDQFIGVQNSAKEDWKVKSFRLENLLNVAHNARDVRMNWAYPSFPDGAVWGPIVMGILLLLVACLNFANTTISLSNRRLKEMGVRKVMGSSRNMLIGQMLIEGFVICLLGMLVGVVFLDWLIPYYNDMWPYLHLTPNYFSNPALLSFMAITVIVTTLFAASYPAFYLSNFNPANIFRGNVSFGGSNLFSRLLLGTQVLLSISSVITGFAFAKNTEFQKNADLGYPTKDVITIPVFEAGDVEKLENALRKHPQFNQVAGSNHVMDYHYIRKRYEREGQDFEGFYFAFGIDYMDLLDLKMVEGRPFDRDKKMDEKNAILVNETFAKLHGGEDILNSKITFDSTDYSVVGIAKDFYYEGFWKAIEPCIIKLAPKDNYNFVVARTNEANLLASNELIQNEWAGLFPNKPYEGMFQTELIADELLVTTNIQWLALFMALIAVLQTATGLFALVSLNILKRMKEIAIRKVVGASLGELTYILHKNFLWIFLLAAIGGCFLGTFYTTLLMDQIFVTNSGVSSLVLLISILAVFAIAVIVVGLKIREVAVTNPSDILRSE